MREKNIIVVEYNNRICMIIVCMNIDNQMPMTSMLKTFTLKHEQIIQLKIIQQKKIYCLLKPNPFAYSSICKRGKNQICKLLYTAQSPGFLVFRFFSRINKIKSRKILTDEYLIFSTNTGKKTDFQWNKFCFLPRFFFCFFFVPSPKIYAHLRIAKATRVLKLGKKNQQKEKKEDILKAFFCYQGKNFKLEERHLIRI